MAFLEDSIQHYREAPDREVLVEELLCSLLDNAKAPAHELPSTGVGTVWEEQLSRCFVFCDQVIIAAYIILAFL